MRATAHEPAGESEQSIFFMFEQSGRLAELVVKASSPRLDKLVTLKAL